jgi:hypothetical protein
MHIPEIPMHINKFARQSALLLTATFLLAACSSGPKIFTNEDPSADFSQFSTYDFEPVLGTDEGKGYRSVFSNYLVAAMDDTMQARGYKKSANPDLLINFYVHTQEKIRTTQQPTTGMGGYYGYRGGAYGAYGGYETTVTQYTEGTVNIDLINRASSTLAWEGVAVGKVTDKVRENLEEASTAIVAEIMAGYAYTAPGFVPPTPAE